MPFPIIAVAIPVIHAGGGWIASTAAGGYIAGTLSVTYAGAFVAGNTALVATGAGIATVGASALAFIGLGG